jgi:hypothetical protein
MVNIYELLNKIIVNKRYGLSANLFTQSDRDSLDDGDIPLLDLLRYLRLEQKFVIQKLSFILCL